MSNILNIITITLLLSVFASANAQQPSTNDQAPNFIVMIGDDMAIETLSCYQVGENPAVTPNLDQLCESGVRFDNFWSQPVCSPTRATMLTGQYGFVTGVGGPVPPTQGINWNIPNATNNQANPMGGITSTGSPGSNSANTTISADAKTFVQALKAHRDYQTAALGKWHLASNSNGALKHPSVAGFDHYAGSLRSGGVTEFNRWSKVIDGSEPFGQTSYAMSDKIDDGLAWLSSVDENKPWFLWVAFNAPHSPFHKPPLELLNSEQSKALNADGPLDGEDPTVYYQAMIEAMDSEIGRLLSSLDEETRANTYVIFMGDNGTPDETVTAPFQPGKAKGSVYQGGVNVPLMIAGPGINAGQTSVSLANSVDLFATFLDLSDVPLDQAILEGQPFHSVSLKPILHEDTETVVRPYAYADLFGVSGGTNKNARAIRNGEYKLIQDILNDTEEFYNLSDDPYEDDDLLQSELNGEQQQNFTQLKLQLETLTGK